MVLTNLMFIRLGKAINVGGLGNIGKINIVFAVLWILQLIHHVRDASLLKECGYDMRYRKSRSCKGEDAVS